jgi:hypothetical protein
MPPPPASRRTDVQRSLRVGRTLGSPAEISMAGFMVKVTMLTGFLLLVIGTPELTVREHAF